MGNDVYPSWCMQTPLKKVKLPSLLLYTNASSMSSHCITSHRKQANIAANHSLEFWLYEDKYLHIYTRPIDNIRIVWYSVLFGIIRTMH